MSTAARGIDTRELEFHPQAYQHASQEQAKILITPGKKEHDHSNTTSKAQSKRPHPRVSDYNGDVAEVAVAPCFTQIDPKLLFIPYPLFYTHLHRVVVVPKSRVPGLVQQCSSPFGCEPVDECEARKEGSEEVQAKMKVKRRRRRGPFLMFLEFRSSIRFPNDSHEEFPLHFQAACRLTSFTMRKSLFTESTLRVLCTISTRTDSTPKSRTLPSQ